MNHRQPYRQSPMNPLTGIWVTHRTAFGYRYASPNGERQPVPTKALPNPHSVSTTAPPFRHTPYSFWPRHATTVWRNLPQPIPNSELDFHLLRQSTRPRNRPILLWLTVLQQRPEHLAERGPDGGQVSEYESVRVLRE